MSAHPRFASRDEIARHQLTALRALLEAVAAGNAFYAPRLRQAGLDRGVESLQQFAERMPPTTKAMLVEDQRQHPPYGTNLTYPLSAYSRFNQTSGTQGEPLRWLDTRQSWQWMVDNWKQIFAAAGVTAEDCLYFAFSFGPFLGFWTAFEAACQLGCRCLPGGGLSSAARLLAMRENAATVLLCTPTYARRLEEVAIEENIDLATLAVRRIIVAGEPGGSVPVLRQKIESQWPRATVFDHHGMTEIGPVSYQCPEQPGTLMVLESAFIAEILDPQTHRAVPRGEIGELVLTNLGRTGSPLLRYRTGDLVREDTQVAEKYGRVELALRGGILGRADDMVLVRGVNVYPMAVDEVLRGIPEVVEYRVQLSTDGPMVEMRLEIEPDAACGEPGALVRKVQSRLRSRFNLRVPVRVCPPGSLPRFEMKARRWVRM